MRKPVKFEPPHVGSYNGGDFQNTLLGCAPAGFTVSLHRLPSKPVSALTVEWARTECNWIRFHFERHNMTSQLKDKWVLITGASSGFGAEAARAFAVEHSNLLLGARR